MSAALDLTPEDLTTAEARLAQVALQHYGAPDEEVQTDPRVDLGVLDPQRSEQLATLLHTLGYLPEPPCGLEHRWVEEAIQLAWAEWRDDWQAWAATAEGARDVVLDLGTEPLGDAGDNAAALRALKACATLEGEVTLRRWPEPGRTTLASRIALFRLRLYGLGVHDPGTAMPPAQEGELLEKARDLMAGRTALPAHELINRLGNLHRMTDELIDWVGARLVVLAARERAAELEGIQALDVFGRIAVRLLPRDDAQACALNTLTLRVLQVRLWTLGYYDGAIDGDWGRLSGRALAEFARDFGMARRHTWLGALPDGRVVLDATKVLERFRAEVDDVAERTERRDIDAALAEADEHAGGAFWDALAQTLAEKDGDTKPGDGRDGHAVAPAVPSVRRVRYFGWRGIFAAFGRFRRRAGGFVRLAMVVARDHANRLHGLLRNIARYVADAARVAVRVAALGVRRLNCWLTGTPVVTPDGPHFVATFWQQDFDTVNVISAGCPAELVARHGRVLDWMQRSTEAMLRVGVEIAQALLALGNWLLFAWRALRVVRRILREVSDPCLRELVAETAPI